MSKVRLRRVTFESLSALRHEVLTSSGPRFRTPEFLVVRYFGTYRDGAEGRGDSLYIVAAATAAHKAWFAPSLILDFRALAYCWGNEMQWITGIVWNPALRAPEPFAVVVGDRCRAALQTLFRDDYQSFCVETPEAAFALCREKVQEHRQRLKEFRGQPD